MMFRYLIVTLLLLVLGCNNVAQAVRYNASENEFVPGNVFPIYVDKTFSDKDRLSIEASISRWNDTLNKQMFLDIVSYHFDMEPSILAQNKNWFILNVDSKITVIHDPCNNPPLCNRKVLAWVDKIGGRIIHVVRDRIDSQLDLTLILVHEIGHLLSLNHVGSSETSIMSWPFDRSKYACIEQGSAHKVAITYNLNFRKMNYCILE